MALDFNVNPYWDDYDESKNYHKILFKPGISVQARELNQLQTELKDQISRFANHVFVEGSIVLNSERFFDNDLKSLKYVGSITDNVVGLHLVGETSGTVALIKGNSIQQDGNRLIYRVISGNKFLQEETITYTIKIGDTDVVKEVVLDLADTFSDAMMFSVNAGIIYARGNFVYTEAQSIILNDESNLSSHSVGFRVSEFVVSNEDDESLLDNAQGTPNFSAPGADRYAISLDLVSVDVASIEQDFIEIAKITNGELTFVVDRTVYGEIEKELARRTFDESGNYTVSPFTISFEEHISTAVVKPIINAGAITGYTVVFPGENYTSIPTITISGDGVGATAQAVIDNNPTSATYQKLIAVNPIDVGSGYSYDETFVTVSGDINKLSAKISPGKAYIKGFEFESKTPTYLTIDKARTTEQADNLDIQVSYGNYVFVKNLLGLYDIGNFATVELHDVVRASATPSTTIIGYAKVRNFSYVSGTIGTNSAIYRLYLFDIVMNSGKQFSNVESINIQSGGSVVTGADIDNLSKIGGNPAGDVFLSGTDRTSLVFPLNHPFVKSLKDELGNSQNDYTFRRVFNTVNVAANSASISTANGLERFVGGAGSYSSDNIINNYHVVVVDKGTSALTNGQIIQPTAITGGVITSGAPQSATFTFSAAGSYVVAIIASINANAQTEKTKSLQPYEYKVISSPKTVRNEKDSLGVSDLYTVKGIYKTSVDPTASIVFNPTTGDISFGAVVFSDVTQNYIIDNGQRDDYYDHANIIVNRNPPLSTDFIVVVYNYFQHTNSGFCGVGSYSIPYDEIPSYKSTTTGIVYNLSDCIDFRPRRVNNSTAFSNYQLPTPTVEFQTDYSYYVGRIDRIVANSSKTFSVKYGIPSAAPQVPTENQDGMSLYVIQLPPYTRALSDIGVRYIENKRYTMRDIGRLEGRIDILEYYTQLSLLERSIYDEQILDSNNLAKFKNGFFVDNFTTNNSLDNLADENAWSRQIWGWWNNRNSEVSTWNNGASRLYDNEVGDSLNLDYSVAIDPLNNEIRPEADVNFLGFRANTSTNVNTKKSAELVSLRYTEVNLFRNLVASKSINVNPYDVIGFTGDVKLIPSSDIWVDTVSLPSVTKITNVQIPDAATQVINNFSGSGNAVRITSSTTTVVTDVLSSSTVSLGTQVVDVQYIPFARERTVIGIGKKLKPKARLYSFVEDLPFGANTKPMTVLEVDTFTGTPFDEILNEEVSFRTVSTTGTVVCRAKVGIFTAPLLSAPTKRLLYVYDIAQVSAPIAVNQFVTANGKSARVTKVTNYTFGAPIVPDEFGSIGVEYQIPPNTIKTGIRNFRLIDNIDNQVNGNQSMANAQYFSLGTLQTKQETLLTTRTLQSRTVIEQTGNRYWVDPLAQTFLVNSSTHPRGYHITSVDLYFRTKSSTIPVTVEITRTVNGFPESVSTSIPFAIATLNPSQVNVSETGTVATKFVFDNPIHLIPGEYAIVIKANTIDYEVFVGEMGRTDLITNQIISKQPTNGVLFKSQNASTWTPYQDEDLKYAINIAEFASSGYMEFNITDVSAFDYSIMRLVTSTALPTGTFINWSYKGLNAGSPNVADSAYIAFSPNVDIDLNKVKRIVDGNSFTLRADLISDDKNVSPVIDVDGLGLICIDNIVNNTIISVSDGEEVSRGGDAEARYISKQVTLADGFDASNIVVTLDAYKPAGTDVRVYYKVSPVESATPFDDNLWVAMSLRSPVANSRTINDYREHKFYPENSFNEFGVPIDYPISPRFNVFAIKIVLVSANKAIVPKVRKLRAIATES